MINYPDKSKLAVYMGRGVLLKVTVTNCSVSFMRKSKYHGAANHISSMVKSREQGINSYILLLTQFMFSLLI